MPLRKISFSKNSVTCSAYAVSKAEKKMKDNKGISSSKLKLGSIFERRIQQVRGKIFFFMFLFVCFRMLKEAAVRNFFLCLGMLTYFFRKNGLKTEDRQTVEVCDASPYYRNNSP